MNEAQAAAATASVSVPLLIVAGAGSGKTLTMVRRIEHIIKVTNLRQERTTAPPCRNFILPLLAS